MRKHVVAIVTSAVLLSVGVLAADAQQNPGPSMQQPGQQQTTQQGTGGGMMGRGMMGDGAMMGDCMMDHGTMGLGMMGMRGQRAMMNPFFMRVLFALMDADGSGTISLQEFQQAHERLFKAMDTDHNGTLTLEEMEAFMHGKKSAPQQ